MGNQAGTLKKHIETAEKTGALSFTDKKLEKVPPELVKVSNLRNLDLSVNKIQELPPCASFAMLKTLTLNRNRISVLPDDIDKLVKLESLSLGHNLIGSLPKSCSQLKHLKEINLSHNQLREFPAPLLGLMRLNTLDLTANKITSIPDGVNKLEATELNLNQNEVSSVSEDISRCPRLKTLRLEENCLTLEAIPPSLLGDSTVSLVALEGNLFDVKTLDKVAGYDKYMERYTAVKRKLD